MTQACAQCFCGAVQLRVDLPVKWIAHCHCSMCRRYHGAAFVTWFGVEQGQYPLDAEAIAWYRSSPEAERGRCRQCGSAMLFRSTRWPGELHVVLAAIHDSVERLALVTPHSGEPVHLHVYYGDRVDWVALQPREPCYATVPSQDGAPLPDERTS